MLIFLLCQVLICALFPADGGNKKYFTKTSNIVLTNSEGTGLRRGLWMWCRLSDLGSAVMCTAEDMSSSKSSSSPSEWTPWDRYCKPFFGSMFAVQCDQIGWFVKVLGNKKVAQFFVAFSATLKNFDCPVKPNIFWQNLESFGLLFIPISGHTGWHCDLFTNNPWSWIKLRQNSRNFV